MPVPSNFATMETEKEIEMTRIEKAVEVMRASGMDARAWQKHGKDRIYLGWAGKDVKAFFDFDEGWADEAVEDGDDLLGGSALKVFIDAPGVSRSWEVNRSKMVKHGFMLDLVKAGLVDEVCEDWKEIL